MTLTRTALLLLLSTVLTGADCLGVLPDDDDAGEEVLVATDAGSLGLWSAGEVETTAIWTTTIPSANRVALAVDADTVYVGAGADISAFPLGATEGSQEALWTWTASDDVVAMAGPGDGALFVMTTSMVHALSDEDGGELWSVDLLIDLSGVADDALGYDGGNLVLGGNPTRRLDPATGAVTHEYPTSSSDVSDLEVDGGSVYLAAAEGVVALTSATLTESWVHPTAIEVDEVAVGASGVGFALRGGGIGMLVADNGTPVFTTDAQDVYDGLLIAGGLLVVARSDGAVLAFDEADGTEPWAPLETLGGPVGGMDANAQTLFYGHASVLDGINLSDGSSLFGLSPSGRPVAVTAL